MTAVQYSTTPRTPQDLGSPLVAETLESLTAFLGVHYEVYASPLPRLIDHNVGQTSSGLYLHAPTGRAQSVFTPWGELRWRRTSPNTELFGLLQRVTRLNLVIEPYATETGQFGPLYEILEVNRKTLPVPVYTRDEHKLDVPTLRRSLEARLPRLVASPVSTKK